MERYKLEPNELFIMSTNDVYHDDEYGTLTLTDKALVFCYEEDEMIVSKYPLDQIRIVNGKAQTVFGEDGEVDIYFGSRCVTFQFYQLYDDDADKNGAGAAIGGVLGEVGGIVGGIAGSIIGGSKKKKAEKEREIANKKQRLSVPQKWVNEINRIISGNIPDVNNLDNNNITARVEISKYCVACGAPLKGAKCEYCGTVVK